MTFTPKMELSDWQSYDRGRITAEKGVLTAEGAWVSSKGFSGENYAFCFTARAPKEAAAVQIWAGFRHFSRDYRYVVALRGGNNNHLYLGRMGAEGYDKMLALRPLEWSPMPGVWYTLKVVCAGENIAVYVNGGEKPLILVKDGDAPFTAGGVALGGGYLPAEYKDVSVTQVAADALNGVEREPDYLISAALAPEEKEAARARARAAYRPYAVPALPAERLTLSLDGDWLFVPDYEIHGDAAAPDYDDSAAHVIPVPSCWIPLQAWLEGENMRDLNKGMNDNYLVEETVRCLNQTFDYRRTKFAYYRHYLDLPRGIEGKRAVLDFEGIALISAVYVNGVRVGENIGMFTPRQWDISGQVHAGRNLIAVEVYRRLTEESEHAVDTSTVDDNYATAWDILDADAREEEISTKCERRPFCTDDIAHGFYMNNPGGIWRSVKLIISEKLHVEDCFFLPTMQDAAVEVTYCNGGAPCEAALQYTLIHKTTGEYLCGGEVEQRRLAAGERRTVSFKTPTVSPRLWGPNTPNLYHLTFTLTVNGDPVDVYTEQVGFRQVEFKGETLYYNGAPLWVRGGNHMPAHVRPTDKLLARAFVEQALSHNLIATRTHVAPWGSAWLDAADEAGLMVSLEGTWSWLMLEHIPSAKSITLWKEELARLIRRHRNRPSLFLMTMNNEMKFYLHEAPDEVVIEKGRILDGGVKVVRALLPHLPLVCDSAYFRRAAIRSGRYERIIEKCGYDDGDMDDPHGYFGWYNPSFFHFMNGEFGRDYTLPGRPCMSQECATGYPRAEDGLPVRAYLYLHQTPQTTVGKRAYENNDPRYFLSRHGMLTKEMAEMLRRVEHRRTCGVLLFAFETWFYNQHDYRRIQPNPSAEKLKLAYQPVLPTAELFGRHFYAGTTLETEVTLVNDANDRSTLETPLIVASISAGGQVLAEEKLEYDTLPYFETAHKALSLPIPADLPADRTEGTLQLRVKVKNVTIAYNEYDILLATPTWAKGAKTPVQCVRREGDAAAAALLSRYDADSIKANGFTGLTDTARRAVACGPLTEEEGAALRAFADKGGTVILLGQQELPASLLGETPFTAHRQEIVTMNLPESSIFAGIDEMDPAWFADGRRVPYAALGRYSVDRFSPDICTLAETLEWHGYINKPTDYKRFGGTPLFAQRVGKGRVLVSALRTDADDPVASRLTGNILKWDFDVME